MLGKSSLNSKIPSGDRDFNYSMRLSRITLSIIGLWPFRENIRSSNFKFVLTLVSTLTTLLSSLTFVYQTDDDEKMFDSLINSLYMLMTLVKLLMVRCENDKLKVILSEIKIDWKKYQRFSERNKRLIDLYTSKARTSSFVCIFFMEFSITTYFISRVAYALQQPAKIREWDLPYTAVYPFEVTSSLFVPMYLWQLFSVMCLGSVNISIDCLLVTTACHATGQLAALCENIKGYGREQRHRDETLSSEIECSCIRCIIERHVDIVRYCRLVEDAYNLILLTEFIGTTFQFCLQMYIIVEHSNDKNIVGLLSFCIYLLVFNFRLFMYCNVFGAMVEMGEKVGASAYEISWYDFHPEAVRQLMFCILRANKPLNVTAGKFFSLNRNSYKNEHNLVEHSYRHPKVH
ncbi:hypothetical protein TSAR_016066 [Trichomalopsis sarcophagae]|uniref:Odorant receptor n=1 Tax=Trichomalopsis sarcophagae TaxID=543379 RepID=A0A232FAY7_9HYME|nr:hypothetical protein TSAR_016066 [Trichomalopsis sarcophagae]